MSLQCCSDVDYDLKIKQIAVRRLTMRGEVREDLKGAGQLAAEGLSVEKQQEQLLMNKLASNGRLPAKPQSAFLQRKLQQQRVSILRIHNAFD